jgi:hypothetical protein
MRVIEFGGSLINRKKKFTTPGRGHSYENIIAYPFLRYLGEAVRLPASDPVEVTGAD